MFAFPGRARENPMNELGQSSPVATSDVNLADAPVAIRRPYVAPAIVEFGSVTEFTRGSGSSTLQDARRTTRIRARG